MARESELVEPLGRWLHQAFGAGNTLLIHEEPQGRGGRRPDLLAVFSRYGDELVTHVRMVAIEIENSSKGALRDPRNGLRQLRKYSAHAKFLALPRLVIYRSTGEEILPRCQAQGAGLLSVDLADGSVEELVTPVWGVPSRQLPTYPKTMERWMALRASKYKFRWISGQRIFHQE